MYVLCSGQLTLQDITYKYCSSLSGRSYTLSVALPGSVLDNAQSPELRTYLAGQIARACTVFCVDEIVVFEEQGEDVKWVSFFLTWVFVLRSFTCVKYSCQVQTRNILKSNCDSEVLIITFYKLPSLKKHWGGVQGCWEEGTSMCPARTHSPVLGVSTVSKLT